MNKFNRTLAGVIFALTLFLMGAGPYAAHQQGIVLTTQGNTRAVHTNATTPREMFDEIGLYIHRFDRVTPGLDEVIAPGTHVTLERAFPIYVQIDNNQPELFYARPGAAVVTIAADFAADNRGYSEDQQFFFTPETARYRPERNELVKLQTIRWRTEHEYQEIDFTREYVESFVTPVGQEVLYRAGQPGLTRSVYQLEYIGGRLVSTNLVSNGIYAQPLTEIVHVGVPVPEGMAVSGCGELFSYSRLLLVESTAYTLSFACTGRHPGDPLFGRTASGMMAQRGVVAVDTSVIPFHTQLYIEGYGFAVAGDRGGAIRGYKIDVFVDSMAEARAWGRQHNVRVWIIE